MKLYKIIFFNLLLCSSVLFAQHTQYISTFDYKNINTTTFVNGIGFNDTLLHYYTILRHSFEIQKINSTTKDTSFMWNGLKGIKTCYTKDSLGLFFIRPNDNIIRPCILLTHGNNAMYSAQWSEQMNFTTTDLAMRGYAVAYFENPSSAESKNKYTTTDTRKLFYNGFQAAVAADIYITQHATSLNIDTTQLFSGGLSFGAFCSLSLALADKNNNFIDTLFSNQGAFEAKAINGGGFRKNIKRVFAIGGGLPKADTTLLNSSRMGEFLSENDNEALLFLHGKNDNLVLLNSTKFPYANTDSTYFFVEGPNIIVNNIKNKHLPIENKTIINCNGGHGFINSVCGEQNYNCIQQYQWGYLTEPPSTLSATNTYFTNKLNDTLLKYYTYMVSQIAEENLFIADFFKTSFNPANIIFNQTAYFVQPKDTFSFLAPITFFKIKNTDCDGNEIYTEIPETRSAKNDVNIYPNPVSLTLNIKAPFQINNISVYGVMGNLIQSYQINASETQINMLNYSFGEYIMVLQNGNEMNVKQVIVIH